MMSQRSRTGRGEGGVRAIVRLFHSTVLSLYILCAILRLNRAWYQILRAADALAGLSRLVAPAVLVVWCFRAASEFVNNPSVHTGLQLIFHMQVLILVLGRRRLPPDLLE